VVQAVHNARVPGWTPAASARELAQFADGDSFLLRQARLRLRATRVDRLTVVQARAIAALNLAITDLEERSEVGSGVGSGQQA
jgi:hypothetical protein